MYSGDLDQMQQALHTLQTTGGEILTTISNVLYSGFSQAVSAGAANQQIKTWADSLLEDMVQSYNGTRNGFQNSIEAAVNAFNRYAEQVENPERVSGSIEDPGLGDAAEIKSIDGSRIYGDAGALEAARDQFLQGLQQIVDEANTLMGVNFGFIGGNMEESLHSVLERVIKYVTSIQTSYENQVKTSIENHIENLRSGLTSNGGN